MVNRMPDSPVPELALVTARLALHDLLRTRHDLLDRACDLDAQPFGRRWLQVAASDAFDAWLIAWGEHSELEAHDHGGSAGVLHVLRGGLIESYRDPVDRAAWNVRELRAGESIAIPTNRIHEVHKAGRGPALSVHLYSPPLGPLTFYAPVAGYGDGIEQRAPDPHRSAVRLSAGG
jgi:mannose-6-phosphate isomerase-like protein (cupin superfamily)